LDPASRDLVGEAVLVEPTEPVELQGSSDPVILYRVQGVSEQG